MQMTSSERIKKIYLCAVKSMVVVVSVVKACDKCVRTQHIDQVVFDVGRGLGLITKEKKGN
jgi:hypothetical protein